MFMVYSIMLFFLSIISFILGIFSVMNSNMWVVELSIGEVINLSFSFIMVFDWISLFFLSAILLISSMVMMYSIEYMGGDFYEVRFWNLVLMFVGSMCLLVSSASLFSMMLGWDGLGLISFCLVIYYQNFKSLNAGYLTIISNRIGDFGMIIGMIMLIEESWNLLSSWGEMSYVYWFLLLSAVTKSAQFPFMAWLPEAMAAPTPVSALVHSSTLVTAGVFLLIRLFNNLGDNESVLLFNLSLLTLLVSGFMAVYEMDFSKIVAMSTLSQLGLMILVLSCGGVNLCYFHMVTHAFFKSMLFLCAGFLIHSYNSNQDLRYFGGVGKFSPIVSMGMLVSLFCLGGVPFLSGFYSSDLIVDFMNFSKFSSIYFMLFYLGMMLTMVYSVRLLYFGFVGGFSYLSCYGFMESPKVSKSIFFLMMIGVIYGSMVMWMVSPVSGGIMVVSWAEKMILLMIMGLGCYGFYLSGGWLSMSEGGNFGKMMVDFFGMKMLSTMMVGKMIFMMESVSLFESGWGENFGAQGVYNIFMEFSKKIFSVYGDIFLLQYCLLLVVVFFMFLNIL